MNDASFETSFNANAAPVEIAQTSHDTPEELSSRGVATVFAIIAAFLAIVGAGTAYYGLVFLGLTALTAVPIVYIILLLLTVGK